MYTFLQANQSHGDNSGMIQQMLGATERSDEDGQPCLTMDNVRAITRDMVIAGGYRYVGTKAMLAYILYITFWTDRKVP
jgi:hypothetical protein